MQHVKGLLIDVLSAFVSSAHPHTSTHPHAHPQGAHPAYLGLIGFRSQTVTTESTTGNQLTDGTDEEEANRERDEK